MPNRVKLEDLLDVLETVLSDGGEITFTPLGNSMRPMLISGRDEITLKKPQGRLKSTICRSIAEQTDILYCIELSVKIKTDILCVAITNYKRNTALRSRISSV